MDAEESEKDDDRDDIDLSDYYDDDTPDYKLQVNNKGRDDEERETPLAGGKLKLNTRGFWNWYEFNQLDWIRSPSPALESVNYSEDEYETELGARYERALGARMNLELVGLQKLTGSDIVSPYRSTGFNGDFFLDQKTSESIGRGVLDTRDFVYFACFCGFFLYANALVLQSRREKG